MKKLSVVLSLFLVNPLLFAAFTERYVTVAGAGAHDGTSEADAWSFSEMISAAPAAGVRVNVKAGSYSVGAYTLGAGSATDPFVIRGYNTTIGDLDNLGRNTDGSLNTTNMPDITITSAWTISGLCVIQNLDITGALSTYLLAGGTNDNFSILSCNVVNTQNNASAGTLNGDDSIRLINSDFYCSGAAHSVVVDIDSNCFIYACRFRGIANVVLVDCRDINAIDCVFWGNATGTGVSMANYNASTQLFSGNTFYNLSTAISLPNTIPVGHSMFINNSLTDCTNGINSAYSGTENHGFFTLNNRTRDVTTLYTGLEEITAGAVTTDTGGASTDFVDAGAGNFRLISGAPAKATGLPAYRDIGAYQREEAGSAAATVSNSYAH